MQHAHDFGHVLYDVVCMISGVVDEALMTILFLTVERYAFSTHHSMYKQAIAICTHDLIAP